jgi:serine protease Do
MHRRLVTNLALLGLTLIVPPTLARLSDVGQRPPRAFLGVTVEAAREGERGGAVVREVTPDSPAAQAGLKAGDAIVKVGDKDVRDPDDLVAAVARHKPGEKLNFHVVREGQERDLSVTLGERPARGEGQSRERAGGFLGVLSRPLTPEAKERLGVAADQGAVVAEVMPGSPAAKAGLRPGDVITAVGGQPVTDPDGLRQAVQQAGAGRESAMTVLRGQEKMEVQARLEEPPVDGIALPPLRPGGRPFTARFFDADKVGELERRVNELERRVQELERKRGPEE